MTVAQWSAVYARRYRESIMIGRSLGMAGNDLTEWAQRRATSLANKEVPRVR